MSLILTVRLSLASSHCHLTQGQLEVSAGSDTLFLRGQASQKKDVLSTTAAMLVWASSLMERLLSLSHVPAQPQSQRLPSQDGAAGKCSHIQLFCSMAIGLLVSE